MLGSCPWFFHISSIVQFLKMFDLRNMTIPLNLHACIMHIFGYYPTSLNKLK
jgi:hypothetical protein